MDETAKKKEGVRDDTPVCDMSNKAHIVSFNDIRNTGKTKHGLKMIENFNQKPGNPSKLLVIS